ncbi:MAG: hypothetical protein HUU16_13685 [Candidatus Omnitrophica bacterium]|nr:hypothetical protein [bacterium]NUN97213.1 hypothetical protein [Candidatus Omnitrophota bacterium]
MSEGKPLDPLKSAWEPGAAQLAASAFFGGWILAAVLENFLLGQSDVNLCLSNLAKSVFTLSFGPSFWNDFVPWVVVPWVAALILFSALRQAWKPILILFTLGFAGILAALDLNLDLFT